MNANQKAIFSELIKQELQAYIATTQVAMEKRMAKLVAKKMKDPGVKELLRLAREQDALRAKKDDVVNKILKFTTDTKILELEEKLTGRKEKISALFYYYQEQRGLGGAQRMVQQAIRKVVMQENDGDPFIAKYNKASNAYHNVWQTVHNVSPTKIKKAFFEEFGITIVIPEQTIFS